MIMAVVHHLGLVRAMSTGLATAFVPNALLVSLGPSVMTPVLHIKAVFAIPKELVMME